MANLNVNIANKLLSYVRHGVDVSDEIARVYNNSMIFIGDEQQIYVPVMQAYVGIGMTSYNNTINRIASVEQQIADLANTLTTDMVSKIYANYSLDEANGSEGIQKGASTRQPITDKIWALNNEITIKGVNDYDPNTGFARKNDSGSYYTIQTAIEEGQSNPYTVEVVNSNYYHSYAGDASLGSAIPTSGIKVTPHWGEITRVENPITHQSIEKRIGNYIEIDDTLTWSYMTSAYAYTLSFARNFTNSEIDKVYHDLLGDSNYVYDPELFTSVITDVTTEINKLSATDRDKIIYDASAAPGNSATHTHYIEPGKRLVYNPNATAYYMVDTTRPFFYASYTTGSDVLNGTKEYHQLSEDQLLKLAAGITLTDTNVLATPYVNYATSVDSPIENFPQLYTRSIEYGSTYNMNIADGIQTLKEVAYLLDLLSDGSLGSVTYLTYSQFNDEDHTNGGSVMEVANVGTYHVIVPTKANPADDEEYGYFVKTGDPENLGISIAYSIAGNKAQIDDLHKHTDLIEQGKSSLRSIQSTSSNYVNLDIESTRQFKDWTNTDANEGNQGDINSPAWKNQHPNYNAKNSYVVGDVNLRVNVQTGITYTTIYSADGSLKNPKFVDEFGVVWYGQYTAADMKNLTADGTYYQIDVNSDPNNPTMNLVDSPVLAYQNQAEGVQYYWIPLTKVLGDNYVAGQYVGSRQNAVYTKIDKAKLISLPDDEYLPKTTLTKNEIDQFFTRDSDGEYRNPIVSEPGGKSAAEKIGEHPELVINNEGEVKAVYYISSFEEVVLHSWVPGPDEGLQDALATTDWTYAFVTARLQDIANDLEDILTQANQYTDDRIAELDNEYKYSDFETYWTSYITYWEGTDPSIAIAGSSTYNSAYSQQYEAFKNRNETYIGYVSSTGTLEYSTTQYRLSYQTNSRYTFNVVEEDGIVNAETRELPTDTLIADVEIWGDDSNLPDNKFIYAPVTITGRPTTDDTPFIEALFNWSASNNDNQVFVQIENGVMEKVPTTEAQPWSVANAGIKWYDAQTGTYQDYPSSTNAIPTMADYRDTLDKKWVQLYKPAPKYGELNLNAAEVDTNNPTTKVVVDGYTLELNGDNVAVSGTGKYGAAAALLYYISGGRDNKSTDYFTVENKHHSFEHNGNGENTLGLTAHITKIEDAAEDNTGFADAYDVQSYIDNVITWVDVSATVTPEIVASSEKYYRHVTLDAWNAYNDSNAAVSANSGVVSTDGNLYTLSGTTFSQLTGSPATAIFWADDNKFYHLTNTPTAEDASRLGHVAIKIGNDMVLYAERFNATGINDSTAAADAIYSAASDYYVQIESAKINPRNLTLTEYK